MVHPTAEAVDLVPRLWQMLLAAVGRRKADWDIAFPSLLIQSVQLVRKHAWQSFSYRPSVLLIQKRCYRTPSYSERVHNFEKQNQFHVCWQGCH